MRTPWVSPRAQRRGTPTSHTRSDTSSRALTRTAPAKQRHEQPGAGHGHHAGSDHASAVLGTTFRRFLATLAIPTSRHTPPDVRRAARARAARAAHHGPHSTAAPAPPVHLRGLTTSLQTRYVRTMRQRMFSRLWVQKSALGCELLSDLLAARPQGMMIGCVVRAENLVHVMRPGDIR